MPATLGGPWPQPARHPKEARRSTRFDGTRRSRPPCPAGRPSLGRQASSAPLRPDPDFLPHRSQARWHDIGLLPRPVHPDVLPLFPSARLLPKGRDTKGTSFFTTNYHLGSVGYASHFPSRAQRLIHQRRSGLRGHRGRGLAPLPLPPLAADRVHAHVPDARLLIALRDPDRPRVFGLAGADPQWCRETSFGGRARR